MTQNDTNSGIAEQWLKDRLLDFERLAAELEAQGQTVSRQTREQAENYLKTLFETRQKIESHAFAMLRQGLDQLPDDDAQMKPALEGFERSLEACSELSDMNQRVLQSLYRAQSDVWHGLLSNLRAAGPYNSQASDEIWLKLKELGLGQTQKTDKAAPTEANPWSSMMASMQAAQTAFEKSFQVMVPTGDPTSKK